MEIGSTKTESRAKYFAEWRRSNPEKVKAIQQRYYSRHREELKARREACPEGRKEEIKALKRKWAREHKALMREYARRHAERAGQARENNK